MSDYLGLEGRRGHEERKARRKDAARGEICRLGDFCQSAYDGFNSTSLGSPEYGECKYTKETFFEATGVHKFGYKLTHFLFADEFTIVDGSLTVKRVWIGFVSVCTSQTERKRLGRWDVLVVLRGTSTSYEWIENVKFCMKSATAGNVKSGFSRVFNGFRDQLLTAAQDDIKAYASLGITDVSITVTGHRFGGALAILAAHHLASNLKGGSKGISVVTFAAPRVGDEAFNDHLQNDLGVKMLRVEVDSDVVPKLPLGSHAGKLLRVSPSSSPCLKKCTWDLWHSWRRADSLAVLLHLVDGDRGSGEKFDPRHKDFAEVNKEGAYLKEELGVPGHWGSDPREVMKYNNRNCVSLGDAIAADEHLDFPSVAESVPGAGGGDDAHTSSLRGWKRRLRALFESLPHLVAATFEAIEAIRDFFDDARRAFLELVENLLGIISKYWDNSLPETRIIFGLSLCAFIIVFSSNSEEKCRYAEKFIEITLDALQYIFCKCVDAKNNNAPSTDATSRIFNEIVASASYRGADTLQSLLVQVLG